MSTLVYNTIIKFPERTGRTCMLVAGLIGMVIAGLFGLILELIHAGLLRCCCCLRYVFSSSYRAEQTALKERQQEAARIRYERIARYGNADPVQYGDSRCAGLGCPGCHCDWDGYDRPPCY